MAGKAIAAKIHTVDEVLDRVQDAWGASQASLANVRIVNGRPVTFTFVAGALTQDVPHGLRRRLIGWFLVRSIPPAPGAMPTVLEDTTVTTPPDPTRFVRLTASAATTATLWVF